MQNTLSLFFCVCLLISCNKDNTEPNSAVDEFVPPVTQGAISAPEIKQEPFKRMEVYLTVGSDKPNAVTTKFTVDVDYFQDGKIKSFDFGQGAEELIYAGNTLSNKFDDLEYLLDEEGLAYKTKGNNNDREYFYQNGFMYYSLSPNPSMQRKYSTEGNLMELVQSNTASYTYTEYKNNIRQEVLGPETMHWSFRDQYLGKFSTNLLKQAKFTEGSGEWILNFSYEFDSQNRVSKVIIDRVMLGNDLSKIVYDLSY